MYKYSFFNDYSEGAHPALLDLMAQTNFTQQDGYGCDALSLQAQEMIQKMLENPGAAVHLVSGGTQANLLVLAALLRPYESVIGAETAHINVHEAGSIEAVGHKINTVASMNGKLTAGNVEDVLATHTDEHMVKPRVVYISNSTEVGTIYTKGELEALSAVCRANQLYLYMDGARLGSALCSKASDLSMPDLGRLVDAFYIGGTKNGALLGEAIVINNPALQADFRFHLKQRGALLAKGRILGAQFVGLFQNDLYFELARHANAMAEKLVQAIQALGFPFLTPSPTNQIFPIFPDALITELQKDYGFYTWLKLNSGYSVARLVTSWATPPAMVDEFIQDLNRLAQR